MLAFFFFFFFFHFCLFFFFFPYFLIFLFSFFLFLILSRVVGTYERCTQVINPTSRSSWTLRPFKTFTSMSMPTHYGKIPLLPSLCLLSFFSLPFIFFISSVSFSSHFLLSFSSFSLSLPTLFLSYSYSFPSRCLPLTPYTVLSLTINLSLPVRLFSTTHTAAAGQQSLGCSRSDTCSS